jgi:hypothetical protein
MAVRRIAHPSVTDRSAEGRQARDRTPLSSHRGWAPAPDRPDPVALLEEQLPSQPRGCDSPHKGDAVGPVDGFHEDGGRPMTGAPVPGGAACPCTTSTTPPTGVGAT